MMQPEKKMPGHVVESNDGGYMCAHCGGEVGEDGYSESTDVGDDAPEGDVGERTEQMRSAEDDLSGFADAVRKRGA